MKPREKQQIAHYGTAGESITMQLDASALKHIMSVLTDLYSDTTAAVVREYATNAIDSHVEAGVTDPIQVTSPGVNRLNNGESSITIEDFGLGLNVDDLRRVYSLYGASTKRESDEVAGMLGLGGKSALAYGNSFHIRARKNGVQTTALVTRDEQGIGTIKILDTRGTDERNGVRISVPVREQDIPVFDSYITKFFAVWPEGSVLVNGAPPETAGKTPGIWIDDRTLLVRHNAGFNDTIVMGNVPYPAREGRAYVAWNEPVFIHWADMGAVEFAPSREALTWTPDTREYVQRLRERIEKLLPVRIAEEVKDLTGWRKLAAMADIYEIIGKSSLTLRAYAVQTTTLDGGQSWQWQGGTERAEKLDVLSMPHRSDYRRGSIPIVTGYPLKTVTTKTRSRLREYFGTGDAILLHEDTDLSQEGLQGYPKLVKWDTIVASTTEPPKEKRTGKGAASRTSYDWYAGRKHHPSYTGTEPIAGNGIVVCYQPLRPSSSFLMPDNSNRAWAFPEAHVAIIQQRQVDKFKRLFPDAIHVDEYVEKRRKEIADQTTEDERIKTHAVNTGVIHAAELHRRADEIADPELQRLVKILFAPSPGLEAAVEAEARRFVPEPKKWTLDPHERYPLLSDIRYISTYNVDEVLFYLNSKWNTLKERN